MQLIAVRAGGLSARGFFGFIFLMLWALAAAAQTADMSVDDMLDQLRQQVEATQKVLAKPGPDADLQSQRSNALAAQVQALSMVEELQPQRRSVQERLAELGTPPVDKKESVDIAALRKQLDKSSSTLDAQVKLAGLLAVEAGQLADQISVQRRAQFQTELGRRTASILAPVFWNELRGNYAVDADHLGDLIGELLQALRTATLGVWLAMAAAWALLLWSHRQAKNLLWHFATTRIPHGRLRRSLFAVVRVLLSVLVWGMVAAIARTGLEWRTDLSALPHALLLRSVGLACFGGYVVGLGRALLAADRPSWRLPALPDTVATGLRWFPLVFAVITTAGWLVERLYALVNASLATTVALNCMLALVLGISMVIAVGRGERLRRQLDHGPNADRIPPRPLWLGVLAALVWLVLVGSVLALLLGYVALGGFMVRQLAWTGIVASSTYLLLVLIDDVCMGWLATNNPDNTPAGAWRMRDQAAVLVSGLGRTLVALVALTSVLSPFGEGPPELLNRVAQFGDGLAIGEVELRPMAVLLAVAVLVVGLSGVRLLKRWLVDQLLPTTNLDAGMQMSTSSLFGYAGGVLVVAVALSAVGIGLERVAWVASALSVGIGFGLQAVVQNFVSGLILLAERPVKVGDWVVLGTVEGDIRRINVRATEIQMSDRSTVIVPNSEFITKTVRNITHASPLGLVQIKLPMPLDTDVEQVRALMLACYHDHAEVQASPEPSVALDGIDNGKLVFNATAYVGSPRMSYGVRSDVLFEVLKRLREAKLPLSNPATMVLREVPLVGEAEVAPISPIAPIAPISPVGS